MNAAGASQGHIRSQSQQQRHQHQQQSYQTRPQQQQSNGPNEHHHDNPHVLSPKEAALRGASMAFAKQKPPPPPPPPQQQQTRHAHRLSLASPSNHNHNQQQPPPASPRDNSALSAATSAARQTPRNKNNNNSNSNNSNSNNSNSNSSGRLSRQTTGSERGGWGGEELERERERLALFLSSPGTEQQPRSPFRASPAGSGSGSGSGAGAAGAGGNRGAAGPRSASFIAATLAASRSVSPSPTAQGGGGGGGGNSDNGSAAARRAYLGEPAKIRRVGSVGTSSSEAEFSTTSSDDHPDTSSLAATTSLISMFEDSRRDADAESVITSPEQHHEGKARAKSPKPKVLTDVSDMGDVAIRRLDNEDRNSADPKPSVSPARGPSAVAKTRPEVPKKSTELPGKSPLELKRLGSRKLTRRPSPPIARTGTDGHGSSKSTSPEIKAVPRPSSAGSASSNDSFVSASSTPTRAESPLVYDAASRTMVPRAGSLRRAIPHHPAPAQQIRRTPTGSSSLTLDSLSDAIMAGSLASARHTPAHTTTAGSRTPPPVPPSRLKKVGARKPASPHRMRQTLRQPRSVSDDEEERRPHHKKKLIGNKKHTHHEGSRNRWRNEITEREKKRYEALWASNRGLFLVPQQQHPHPQQHQPAGSRDYSPDEPHQQLHQQQRQQVVRTESYEELSDHVPNVVVRDLWGRSRLPAEELAEVWDLVYGHTAAAAGGGSSRVVGVHAALNKPEFVVGMWLVDQRLRGRKIPTRVGDSVWDSAKGLRVWSAVHGNAQGRGKGK